MRSKIARGQILAMLAPYLLGLVGLVLVPFALTMALAFTEYDLIRSPRWVGLDNVIALTGDPIFWTALINSIAFAAIAVPLRLLIALGLALLLHRRAAAVGTARGCAVLPTAVPEIAYGLGPAKK